MSALVPMPLLYPEVVPPAITVTFPAAYGDRLTQLVMESEATFDSDALGGQATGADALTGQYDPDGQAMGETEPSGQYVPGWARATCSHMHGGCQNQTRVRFTNRCVVHKDGG